MKYFLYYPQGRLEDKVKFSFSAKKSAETNWREGAESKTREMVRKKEIKTRKRGEKERQREEERGRVRQR
jgi:hypothetical protein